MQPLLFQAKGFMRHFYQHRTLHQQGLLLVIVATLLFSGKGILIKLAYGYGVQPAELMFIRMMIALPFYLTVLWGQHQTRITRVLDTRSALWIICYGLCGYYLASWFDLTGLVYLTASLERLVLYTYPGIVVLLSVIFLGKPLQKEMIISLIITYVGLFVVFARDISLLHLENSQQLWGAFLVFMASASFAVYLLGSELMMRTISSKLFTALAMVAASVAIIVHYVLNYEFSGLWHLHMMVYVYGALIAVVCTVMPSFMLSAGVQRVGAATGSGVGSLGPVVTLLMAVVFLDEKISIYQAVGFMLVIIGVVSLGKVKSLDKPV